MRTLINKLKRTFINGLLVTLPMGLTLYILWLVYRFIINLTGRGSYLGGLISGLLQPTIGRKWFPGIGVIFTVLLIFLIGLATRVYIGRKIYQLIDRAIDSTPIVNKMYATVKQITSAILNRDLSSFRDVVMIDYPRKGIYSIGFVTNERLGKLEDIIGKDSVAVFIFTTPNPLSGITLIVPREQLTYLDLNVEGGLRLVLSMGIVIPTPLLKEELSKRDLVEEED